MTLRVPALDFFPQLQTYLQIPTKILQFLLFLRAFPNIKIINPGKAYRLLLFPPSRQLCRVLCSLSLFFHSFPDASVLSAVYREGHLNVPRHDPLPLPRVLFDTGALHGSYISHSFVHSHREILSSHLLPTNSSVTLADNHTEVHIDHIISLPMSFRDDSGSSHSATITLHVFPMVHNTVIIGLPDILFHFGQFFLFPCFLILSIIPKSPSVRLLKRPTLSAVTDSSVASPTIPSHQLPTIDPWSTLLAHAPEDLLTPLPVNFSEALHFMEMGYEDSVKEYFS